MFKPKYIGKVRDVFDLGDRLILRSSDRVSAFDCVFQELIPEKGIVLNQISNLWFRFFSGLDNHILETDYKNFPPPYNQIEFADRSVLVRKCERIDFECVVRGFVSGSAYKEYKSQGTIAGLPYPPNLLESSELSDPIFTPAVKNDKGHDENISEAEMKNRVGEKVFSELKEKSLFLYTTAKKRLEKENIILCDTKFEFGVYEGKIILIDELLTPDSSRYWEKDSYKLGISPPSLDKQILRNYLETLDWDKNPPAPKLPDQIIQELIQKYKELQVRIERCLSEK